MSRPNVYNMPSGVPFLSILAEGLSRHYGDRLQDALILLPTRRAVRGMQSALAKLAQTKGQSAVLLPRMRPLADINPEEPPFEPGELAGQVPPAMPPVQRRFEMARLITAYHRRAADLPLDPASALALADPLLAIMDDVAMEEVTITDTEEWQKITTDSALHFQHAATLYKIIETHWPERLSEIGMMEPQARKVKLLNLLSQHWATHPPDYPVIIAGSTGTLKATAKLMACVANMPSGMVVLPGLQMISDQNWDSIDIQHPQWSMKNLLERVNMDRDEVQDFRSLASLPKDKSRTDLRRMVINEALVAVDKTSDWLRRINKLKNEHGDDVFKTSMTGLSLINAPSDEDEALSIALILRDALRDKDKTAALVTPDQGLARRVQARLKRWDITVDMSQGEPLSQTGIGRFLMALMQLAKDPDGPFELSVLFNQPLCHLGRAPGDTQSEWQRLERDIYRGVRPPANKPTPELVKALHQTLSPLLNLPESAQVNLWAEALINIAAQIGADDLWNNPEGQKALSLLEGLAAFGADLPATHAEGMERLLHRMMQNTIIRRQSTNQPRLSILGPLEARLIEADVIILGGLNEGVWPSAPAVDPFLSRQMRKALELSLPERRYGLSAHDFAELAANPTVYLTRSERSDSGPTVASRWVWRLRTLLKGATEDESGPDLLTAPNPYLQWAQEIDHVKPDDLITIAPPDFAPPVDKRWAYYKGEKQKGQAGRRISITQVQTWIRDPYAIYAQRVLGLMKLDELDMPQDARHFGNAVHKAIENYLKSPDRVLSADGAPKLLEALKRSFADHGYALEQIDHEQARFENISRDILAWLNARQTLGYDNLTPEDYADFTFKEHNFRLTGQADLPQIGPLGLAFFDFKTGSPSSAKTVAAGFDPQLPLAAFLAQQGAFKTIPSGHTAQLGYVRVKGSNDGFEEAIITKPEARSGKEAMALAAEAVQTLTTIIADYDREDKSYPSQPRVKFVNSYGDYDHLARRQEWRGLQDDSGTGES